MMYTLNSRYEIKNVASQHTDDMTSMRWARPQAPHAVSDNGFKLNSVSGARPIHISKTVETHRDHDGRLGELEHVSGETVVPEIHLWTAKVRFYSSQFFHVIGNLTQVKRDIESDSTD